MSSNPLSEFHTLNDLVSLYRPEAFHQSITRNAASTRPGLIIFCSWVGAASKHIAKYTEGYMRLFPDANILLIRSTVSCMFRRSDITPAFKIVRSFVQHGSSDRGSGNSGFTILHAFSNGGANNAVWLATGLLAEQKVLQLDNLILDCAPGQPEISAVSRAITLSMPHRYFLRLIGYYVIYFTVVCFMLVVRLLRVEDTITRVRRSLNNPELFPRSIPRLYLYSKEDTMVRDADVRKHAEDARQTGYKVVREEVFENAPHCALLNEDSGRYWRTVTAVTAHTSDRKART